MGLYDEQGTAQETVDYGVFNLENLSPGNSDKEKRITSRERQVDQRRGGRR